MWKTFDQEMPSDNCKIVALYGDGSGAKMFLNGDNVLIALQDKDRDVIEEMGYLWWAYLPDNFKLWGEE
tara:strand:- start:735 stop:941 length:207 start_codon:yes stop_codon:yes gene_type:complete